MKFSKSESKNSGFKGSHFPNGGTLVLSQSKFSSEQPVDVFIAGFYFDCQYHFRFKENTVFFVINLIQFHRVKQ